MAVLKPGARTLALVGALLASCGAGPVVPAVAERADEPTTAALGPTGRETEIAARAAAAIAERAAPGQVPTGEPDDDLVSCRTLLAAGRVEEAAAGYAALARVYPGDPVVQLAVARFALEDGRADEAVVVLDGLAGRDVVHPELDRLRGAAHLEAGDAALGEALLREELAVGDDSVAAALVLCDYFVARESFGEALAVVAAARLRDADRPDLRILQARLLRDVWRLDEAAGCLDALIVDFPDLLSARAELAEVERARGRRDHARALLEGIPADDAWTRANLDRLRRLREELAEEPPLLTPRHLLAMVRGAENLGARVRALQALLEVPATRRRAIEVGFVQDDAVLRVMAVRAVAADEPALEEVLAIALEDPDPRVRATAARRAVDLPDVGRAVELVLGCLRAEEDPYAFLAAHEGLVACLGPLVDLPSGAERDPSTRQQIRQAWRQQCPE